MVAVVVWVMMMVVVVAVTAVATAVAAAADVIAAAGVELMLLSGWMLCHVHHVQVLLVVVLGRGRLGHVLVDSGNDLRGRSHHWAHHRILWGLVLVGRNVRGWSGGRWRGLRSVVVLLVGLTGRGCGRRRGRRQILQLSGLRRLVVHVPRRERRGCLEVLMMNRRRIRREHLDGARHQRLPGGCCDLNLGSCNRYFPDARLSWMRVLLGRLECGLRGHHVRRYVDLLMSGHVLLARIVALGLLLLLRLWLLLLLHYRSGRLRGVWARRRVTRRIRGTGAARCERLGRRVQGGRFLGRCCWFRHTVHIGGASAGTDVQAGAVLTLAAKRTGGTVVGSTAVTAR